MPSWFCQSVQLAMSARFTFALCILSSSLINIYLISYIDVFLLFVLLLLLPLTVESTLIMAAAILSARSLVLVPWVSRTENRLKSVMPWLHVE